jgi:hypothetical protein
VRDDAELMELEQLLNLLLGAAVRWSEREDVDESVVARIRGAAILLNHRRYIARIPAYRRLAEDRALIEVDDVDVVANELMVTTHLFKSYERAWLESAEYERMTGWLASIFTREPRVALEGVRNVEEWRNRLRGDGVYVTYSSGTSGRLSFVPRDRFTWDALRRNGLFYSRAVSAVAPATGYDCLVLGARGNGLGIQAAARGLTRAAHRSHYLFDVDLGADMLQDAVSWRPVGEAGDVQEETAYAAAFAFLRRASTEGRPVLVFGTPAQVSAACGRVASDGAAVRLAPGSIVVCGGGWKAAEGERIPRRELVERVDDAFGIGAEHVVDTYSTSECNCVFPSCAEGRYHIPPLIEPVVLDDCYMRLDGDDVCGTFGFLDPFAASYPGFVITGDQARLVRGRCGCGLGGWSVVGDIVRTPTVEARGCAGVLASVAA